MSKNTGREKLKQAFIEAYKSDALVGVLSEQADFKELRIKSGMSQKVFADFFGIPKRTVENWEAGVNNCPSYLLDLMKYKLINEGKIK